MLAAAACQPYCCRFSQVFHWKFCWHSSFSVDWKSFASTVILRSCRGARLQRNCFGDLRSMVAEQHVCWIHNDRFVKVAATRFTKPICFGIVGEFLLLGDQLEYCHRLISWFVLTALICFPVSSPLQESLRQTTNSLHLLRQGRFILLRWIHYAHFRYLFEAFLSNFLLEGSSSEVSAGGSVVEFSGRIDRNARITNEHEITL